MALKIDGRDDVDKLDGRDDQDKLDDRGGVEVVQDILRRAGNLGGLLVVAFVTPIPGNGATRAAPARSIRKNLDQAKKADRASKALLAKSKIGARKSGASLGHS